MIGTLASWSICVARDWQQEQRRSSRMPQLRLMSRGLHTNCHNEARTRWPSLELERMAILWLQLEPVRLAVPKPKLRLLAHAR